MSILPSYFNQFGVTTTGFMNPFSGLGGGAPYTPSGYSNFNTGFGGQPQPSMPNQNAYFGNGNIYGGAPMNPAIQYQMPQLPPPPPNRFVPPQDRHTNLYQNIITNNHYIEVPVPVYINTCGGPNPYINPPSDSYEYGTTPGQYPTQPPYGRMGNPLMNMMMMLFNMFLMLQHDRTGSAPPVEEPPVEEPPVEEPPVEEPPVEEPPVEEPPVEEPPVEEPPVEEPPVEEPPVEEPPVEEPPVDGGIIHAAPNGFETLNKNDISYIIRQAAGQDGKLTESELSNYIAAIESGVVQDALMEEMESIQQEIQDLDYDYGGYRHSEAMRLEAEYDRIRQNIEKLDEIAAQGKSLQSVFSEVAHFDENGDSITIDDVTAAAKAREDDNQITDLELGFDALDASIDKNALFKQLEANKDYSRSDLQEKLDVINNQISLFENDASYASAVNELKKQQQTLEFMIQYFQHAQVNNIINRDILNTLSAKDGQSSNISLADLAG